MRDEFSKVATGMVIALLLCLTGCAASPPTRFYTLRPVSHRQVQGQPSQAAATPGALSVYVKPVEIPDFLDRPQIVTRTGQNELRLAEYDRWAGSLAEDITAAVAEDLSQQLQTDKVFTRGGVNGEKGGYSVALRVLRLDCTPGDQVLLRAQWTVRPAGDANKTATELATFTAPVKDTRYHTMVEAVSKVLEELSGRIAQRIRTL